MRVTTAQPPRRDVSPRPSHPINLTGGSDMARDVIIATFENRNQADDAARDIDNLDQSVIDIKSGAIVEKDMAGNIDSLDDEGIAKSWGGIGGATAGALSGRWSARSPARPVRSREHRSAPRVPRPAACSAAPWARPSISPTRASRRTTSPQSPAVCCRATPRSSRRSKSPRPDVDEAVWRHGGVGFRSPDELRHGLTPVRTTTSRGDVRTFRKGEPHHGSIR